MHRPYPDAVGPRASLLVLGDAGHDQRDGRQTQPGLVQTSRTPTGPPGAGVRLRSGDRATAQCADVVEMAGCSIAVQLEEVVQRLRPT